MDCYDRIILDGEAGEHYVFLFFVEVLHNGTAGWEGGGTFPSLAPVKLQN